MAIGTFGLDRHKICQDHGINPSEPGYSRTASYAAVTVWVAQQYQLHTGLQPANDNLNLLASYNLSLARFDKDLDDKTEGSESFARFLGENKSQISDVFSASRAPVVIGSFIRQASAMLRASGIMSTSSDIEEMVAARYQEGHYLGDLYAELISPNPPMVSLRTVLRRELGIGCIIDSIFDYKEDLEQGVVRSITSKELAYVLGFTASGLVKFLLSNSTKPGDIEIMGKKFIRYCGRSLGHEPKRESRIVLA